MVALPLLNCRRRRAGEEPGNEASAAVLRVFSDSQTHCLLTLLAEMTGHEIGSFIIWNFEYGPYYSGPRYVCAVYNKQAL